MRHVFGTYSARSRDSAGEKNVRVAARDRKSPRKVARFAFWPIPGDPAMCPSLTLMSSNKVPPNHELSFNHYRDKSLACPTTSLPKHCHAKTSTMPNHYHAKWKCTNPWYSFRPTHDSQNVGNHGFWNAVPSPVAAFCATLSDYYYVVPNMWLTQIYARKISSF